MGVDAPRLMVRGFQVPDQVYEDTEAVARDMYAITEELQQVRVPVLVFCSAMLTRGFLNSALLPNMNGPRG